MRTFLGIDPGLGGGVAIIDADSRVIVCAHMPIFDGSKKSVDAAALAELLRPHVGGLFGAVEQVGAMPRQGVSSTFKFGTGFGQVLGVLAALGVPYLLAPPSKWKRSYGLGSEKDDARAMASRLFGVALDRKKDDGRAEALLLARYAQTFGRPNESTK